MKVKNYFINKNHVVLEYFVDYDFSKYLIYSGRYDTPHMVQWIVVFNDLIHIKCD